MSIMDEELETLANRNLFWKKYQNAIFVITGATGLIGSLLIRSLLYLNQKKTLNISVIAIVRNPDKAKAIFASYLNDSALKFVEMDFNQEKCKTDAINKADYIIHAAAVTASKVMVSNPVETIMTSINGTKVMLNLAKKSNASMVYVSSMEIYGQTTAQRATEADLGYVDISTVRSCYPESKRMCEMLCNSYASEYGVNVLSARLAQTFGVGILSGENRVFAQFARSAINRQDIVLHTAGLSEGNYVYTFDAVYALLLLLTEGKSGEAYNVSNPKNHITIRGMADLVAHEIAKDKIQVIIDIPEDSNLYGYAPNTKLWLDSNKLINLGWNPTVDLLEAYKRMIIWMKEQN